MRVSRYAYAERTRILWGWEVTALSDNVLRVGLPMMITHSLNYFRCYFLSLWVRPNDKYMNLSKMSKRFRRFFWNGIMSFKSSYKKKSSATQYKHVVFICGWGARPGGFWLYSCSQHVGMLLNRKPESLRENQMGVRNIKSLNLCQLHSCSNSILLAILTLTCH